MIGAIKFIPSADRTCRLCYYRRIDSYGYDFCLIHSAYLTTRNLFSCRCVDFTYPRSKGGALY